jgi:hypothetical protein
MIVTAEGLVSKASAPPLSFTGADRHFGELSALHSFTTPRLLERIFSAHQLEHTQLIRQDTSTACCTAQHTAQNLNHDILRYR